MRISTLAAVAAFGLVAACAEPENRDEAQLSDEATVTTEYGAGADQAAADAAAARANAAADAANAAARDAADPDTVVIDPNADDNVTVQVGPDGTRVSGSVNTD